MLAHYVFLFAEILLLIACGLLVVAIGVGRMESSVGRLRDGLPPGSSAPRWKLPDAHGVSRHTPSALRPQLLLFADRSLKGYPDLVQGLKSLAGSSRQVETLVLTLRGRLDDATMNELGLNLPIVWVKWGLYSRYRIQRIPFALLIGADGTVVARGLVGSAAALTDMLQPLGLIARADGDHGQRTHVVADTSP